jgi:hypothetical protein
MQKYLDPEIGKNQICNGFSAEEYLKNPIICSIYFEGKEKDAF